MKTNSKALLAGASCALLGLGSLHADISFLSGLDITHGGEIVAFDKYSGSLLVTDSFDGAGLENHAIRVYGVSAGGALSLTRTIDLNATFGAVANTYSVSSVAVDPLGRDFGVATIIPVGSNVTSGRIALFQLSTGTVLNTLDVGYHPDAVTFSRNGQNILIANEGEYVSSGPQSAGSVSIVNVSGVGAGAAGVAALTSGNVTDVNFTTGLAAGVTIDGLRNARLDTLTVKTADALDIEPEYITTDNTKAYVSLQENNALAVIDLEGANAGKITAIHDLGTRTITTDASDRGETALNDTVKGLPMPDTITAFTRGGKTYIATANEGDARPDDDDMARVSSSPIDTVDNGNGDVVANVQTGNDGISRLRIIQDLGDVDGDGQIEDPVMFGSRSFSIIDPETGLVVFDSGNMIEQYVLENDALTFNINKSLTPLQDRSDDKGPEPEAIAFGSLGGHDYIFVGAERQNGIFQFDITDLENVFIAGYYNAFTDSEDDGFGTFVSPESIQFVSAEDSPTGEAFIIVGYEGETEDGISGSVALFTVTVPSAIPEPASAAALLGLGALGSAVLRRRRR